MNLERLTRRFGEMGVGLRRNELLAPHTTFRIGGPADAYCEPPSVEALSESIILLRREGCRLFVLGGGSNVLFSDDGFRGIVVGTSAVRGLEWRADTLRLAAGESLAAVLRHVEGSGEHGLGFLSGIPGTVGGAIAMNAGISQRSLGDVVQAVRVVDSAEGDVVLRREECAFGYRTSAMRERGLTILSCELRLDGESFDQEALLARRRATQPLDLPSAGCVFRNPEGTSAGMLIEGSGLKGVTVGRARVSEKHANFIVNLGGATSAEICKLIDIVRQKVYNTFHVSLDLEVEVIDG